MIKKLLLSSMISGILGYSSVIYADEAKFFDSEGATSSSVAVTKTIGSHGFSAIVKPLMPAVVNINTVHYAKSRSGGRLNSGKMHDPFFDQFGEFFERFGVPFYMDEQQPSGKSMSLGSGFIIDSTGYIVTNHHVIKDADEINVKMNDGTELVATIVGSDARTDVALLKVNSEKPMPYVKFGDSNASDVGDWAIAIGNPFGLGGTVTAGIISSKSRDINMSAGGSASNIVDDYIQTDAAINSGNSGGPTFNIDGEVIGMNTAIYSPSGTNIGIGFAIPSNTVQSIVSELKKHGKVTRGMLSIKIQDVTPEIAEGWGVGDITGVLVDDVEKGGAGDKAGLKRGDIITHFNDEVVKSSRKLQIAVADAGINKPIKLKVLRNGKAMELNVKITEDAKLSSADKNSDTEEEYSISEDDKSCVIGGIVFSELTEEQIKRYKMDINHGVVVLGPDVKSGKRKGGEENNSTDKKKKQQDSQPQKRAIEWRDVLQRGDVILEINQHSAKDIHTLLRLYTEAKKSGKKNVVFTVMRDGNNMFVGLPII